MPPLSSLLDTRTVGLVASLLYLVLPIAGWLILRFQDDPVRLRMWTLGSMCFSAHGLLTSLITMMDIPPLPMVLMVGTGFLGFMLRAGALHLHLGEQLPWGRLLLLLVLLMLGFELARRTGVHARSTYGLAVTLAGTAWQAGVAAHIARRLRSTSAAAMAVVYSLLTLAMGWRVVRMLGGMGSPLILGPDTDSLLLPLIGVFSAVFNTIAYIGITLETAHARDLARGVELARATEAQRHSEERSARLLALLQEREQMLKEREQMIHLLAHEVRQPLNNASAALSSARSATSRILDSATASPLLGRLERASNVILQITSILDNTLAASSLLSDESRLAPIEADLHSLIELCLADLSPQQYSRVRVEHDPGLRTATFDPGLMRLALRNLLVNALNHAPSNTPVVLCVSEQDQPLAIVFEVIDQGPGFDPAVQAHAFERGVRGRQSHGLGLGLYIVRRVAELHRGTVEVVPTQPGQSGTRLKLTISQDSPV